MTTENKKSGTKGLIIFILIVVVLLIASLPFHYIFYQDHFYIVPKDNLTFKNTIFTYYDVDDLLKRYNEADFFEREAMRNESIFKKLIEKNILVMK